ncbi:MAG: hypothetical protein R6W90_10315 [Ignavibacteriaceae bacterium]
MAEKKGLIESSEIFIEIRELRNTIAHEYVPSAYDEIFKKVIELAPFLFDTLIRVKNYFKEKYNIK